MFLLFSKTRVAPIKQNVTIPRLELLAMLIGYRMLVFLHEEIQIHIGKFFIWSDSTCCLHWLRTSKPLARFVERRISEIKKFQMSMNGPVSYNYVPSEFNPADCASRGMLVSELKQNIQWWQGPEWLKQEKWPTWNLPVVTKEQMEQIESEQCMTVKPVFEVSSNMVVEKIQQLALNSERFSTLKKLLHVAVYSFRFIKMIMWKSASDQMKEKHLSRGL